MVRYGVGFNHRLEEWWQDVYDELYDEKKEELLDNRRIL